MKHGRKLVGDLNATLEQGVSLLEALTDDQYTAALPKMGASAIGAHYRHHLDHVRSVVIALSTGCVDYDDRVRGTDIEFDRGVAIHATRELMDRLSDLSEAKLAQSMLVQQRSCASGEARPESPTTLMRELAFLQSHAVHHYAVMGLIARLHGVCPPKCFGVMPSTLNYEAGIGVAATA